MTAAFHRLSQTAPDLVEYLRKASEHQLRSAALTACKFAVKQSGLSNSAIDAVLAGLAGERPLDDVLRKRLEKLAAALDEEAFKVQEDVEAGRAQESTYLTAFGRARAGTAVLYATEPKAFEAAVESIYEATATVDDIEPLRAAVLASLASTGDA